jgi:Ca2+-binding RTX toxin-like protein
VHALALTSRTSGVAGTAPFTSNTADTLVAPFPDATLVGGAGGDTFVIGPGAGRETIQNFDPGHDTLQFSASLFANYAAAMTDAKQVGTGTVFTIDAHDSVALQNVSIGSLTASNVHFS